MAAARSVTALIATAITVGLTVLIPQTASAHPGSGPQAVSSKPTPGQLVNERIDRVEVNFSAPLNAAGNTIEVTAPNGRRVSTGETRLATPTTLQTSVKTLTQAGTYKVTFTIAAADHPEQGGYEFKFQPPADDGSTDGATMKWLFLGAAVTALVALVAGIAAASSRRRAYQPLRQARARHPDSARPPG